MGRTRSGSLRCATKHTVICLHAFLHRAAPSARPKLLSPSRPSSPPDASPPPPVVGPASASPPPALRGLRSGPRPAPPVPDGAPQPHGTVPCCLGPCFVTLSSVLVCSMAVPGGQPARHAASAAALGGLMSDFLAGWPCWRNYSAPRLSISTTRGSAPPAALPAACPGGEGALPLPLPNGAYTRRPALVSTGNTANGVPMAPPAPNLGVSQAFKADKNDPNLNLGVGAYRTEKLQPYVLSELNKPFLLFRKLRQFTFA